MAKGFVAASGLTRSWVRDGARGSFAQPRSLVTNGAGNPLVSHKTNGSITAGLSHFEK